MGNNTYLKDPWNLIDFFSLIVSLQSIIFQSGLGMFKAMRAIRILKISRHFAGLKLVLVSLIKSMSIILTLCLFATVFILVMALFPLKFLKGEFFKCYTLDSSV